MFGLRMAMRRLMRSPLYALSVVGVLALAGAALTATGVIGYGVLLSPLPYAEPSELVYLQRNSIRTGGSHAFTTADFVAFRERSRTLESVAGAGAWSPVLTGFDTAERLRGLHVTGELLGMLGRSAILGRVIEPDDDRPEAARVAVISRRLWQRLYGEDAAAVGGEMRLDGQGYTVIGVMPEGFEFPTFWQTGVDVWAPMRWTPAQAAEDDGSWMRVFGRLRDGASLEQASAELGTISEALRAAKPESHVDRGVETFGLQAATVREVRPTLYALASAAGMLWLIAIVNLTALAVVRASGRSTEAAVRRALGESRVRSLRQEALEGGLLALSGAALGVAGGFAALQAISATAPSEALFLLARWRDQPVGLWAAAATLIPAAMAAGALAVAGATAFGGGKLVDRIRARDDAGSSRRTAAMRGWLTGGEVALAVILLAAAGLVSRSMINLASVDPGFDADRVTTAVVSVTGSSFGDEARKATFHRELVERLRATPGIESAALVNHVPLVGDQWGFGYRVEGEPEPEPGSENVAAFRVATPGYFKTMGSQLIAGRDFSVTDDADAPPVAVINRKLALRHFDGRDPLDGRIRIGGEDQPWRQVVGVVADLQQYSWADVDAEVFLPFEQNAMFRDNPGAPFTMTAVVRTEADVAASSDLRRIVADLDPAIPVDRVVTLEQAVDRALWQPRVTAWLMNAFAALALTLAGVGLYGVAAQGVAQRRGELGLRMALGATSRDLLALTLGGNLRLVAAGVAVGVVVAWVGADLMRDLLYEVSARDGAAFAAACTTLLLTGLLASFLPARRAAAIDPAEALRRE